VKIPAIIHISDFSDYPIKEIGEYSLYLKSQQDNKIPLPPTYVIPTQTLLNIAFHNHLKETLVALRVRINGEDKNILNRASKKIKKLIVSQKIPEKISQKLFTFYHEDTKNAFLKLIPSYASLDREVSHKIHENIKGEANFIDSILQIWAEQITPNAVQKKEIMPAAIIIQTQAAAVSAGRAYTFNPNTNERTSILIKSVWGNYQLGQNPAVFEVDQRSWDIINKKKGVQSFYFARQIDQLKEKKLNKTKQNQYSLTDAEVIRLAKIIQRIKRSELNHLAVDWQKVGDQIQILQIKPYQLVPKVKKTIKLPQAIKKELPVISMGTPVISGLIEGKVKIINKAIDVKSFESGGIAVLSNLSSKHLPLLNKAAAIICENTITNTLVFKALKAKKITTIVKASFAKKRLANDMRIHVDAYSGKISLLLYPKEKKKEKRKRTLTKVYLEHNLINDLTADLKYADGFGLIKVEGLFFETGYHPLHLIRNHKEKNLEKKLSSKLLEISRVMDKPAALIYRSFNANSNDLLKLKHSETFEQKEFNPFLGHKGALKTIHNFEIFDFELEILAEVNKKANNKIDLMVPFVRSPAELVLIQNHLQKFNNNYQTNIKLWLEINTPENIFNIDDYLRQNIVGVLINLKNLHPLIYAADPNQTDITRLYPLNPKLIKQVIKTVVESKAKLAINNKQIKKILLQLGEPNKELIKYATKHKLDGITTNSQLLELMKQSIIENEE